MDHDIKRFSRSRDPLAGITEDTRKIARYVEKRKLLLNIAWAWNTRAPKRVRKKILAHLYAQAHPARWAGRFQGLRGMLASRLSQRHFLAIEHNRDLNDQLPLVIKVYLALYFDLPRGFFSTEVFFRQYRESQRAVRKPARKTPQRRKGISFAAAVLMYKKKKLETILRAAE